MTKGKITFTGSFLEFLGTSFLLLLLSVPTFGITWLYWLYWMPKYFTRNMEIVLYDDNPTPTHTHDRDSEL